MTSFNKVDKKYALNNSYFKNKKSDAPDSILDIVQYWKQYGELPFEYNGDHWVYDAMCERQKKSGIIRSQYLTPDKTARQLIELTNNFFPKDLHVLDACCGTGQLTKYLIEAGLKVTGFDSDRQMVDICKELYPQGTFLTSDFKNQENPVKWQLIVSNPPYEQKELIPFLDWLSQALAKEGKAILLIPNDYLSKKSPKKLDEIISRFKILHREKMTEAFFHTQWKSEIYVLELFDSYQSSLPKAVPKAELNIEPIENIQSVNLKDIIISSLNPRKRIDEDEIAELAKSIKEIGLLQAIILRPQGEKFEIVCGERRFRAFILNHATEIPAIVRNYSHEQALTMALSENLVRKDLSPMEEAHAFQNLIDLKAYTLEELILKFGKSEYYLRSRLRLLNLIPEFASLLDEEEISIGAGIELSKYVQELQNELFMEHFQKDDHTCWKSLGTKELSGRINRMYTMNLGNYQFDKSQCRDCPFNTGAYSLFSVPEEGHCTNKNCLGQKKADFTFGFCKTLTGNNAVSAVCISHYDKIPEKTAEKLKQEGIEIKIVAKKECPEMPVKPLRSAFRTEDEFHKALDEYKFEEAGYMAEIDDLNNKTEKGLYKRLVYIGENNPRICYIPIEKTNCIDPVEELKEQEKKIKETAMINIYRSTCEFLKTTETPSGELSEFEYNIFMFVMLDCLGKRNFNKFGITDLQKSNLTFEDKDQIIKNITPEQNSILQREFILKHLSCTPDVSSKSIFFLPQFAMQHFPNEIEEITKKHMDTYNKCKVRIEKKMKKVEETMKRN